MMLLSVKKDKIIKNIIKVMPKFLFELIYLNYLNKYNYQIKIKLTINY